MNWPFRVSQAVLVVGSLGLLALGIARGAPADSPIDIIKLFPSTGFMWEQPPIEWDALSKTPFFCGWDEPAYAEEIPNATQSLASRPADDFRLAGPMPVTSIHWWGSYRDWQQPTPPDPGPDAWRITFSANTPEDAFVTYSRPGAELWTFDVSPEQVTAEWAAFDRFPDKPQDSCFKYSLDLEPAYYFWPNSYEGDIFWISITAVYKTQRPAHAWGWKTRPQRWMDGAVEFLSDYEVLPSGLPISGIWIQPIEAPDACGQKTKYDMTFALDTDLVWIKWDQAFTGLRDWAGYEDEPSTAKAASASSIAIKWQREPDLSDNGLGVDATLDTPKTWSAQILADDYQCTLSGPVTQIDVWGCYHLDALPGNDPNNVQFTLSIREDLPAIGRTYSMPGKILWTKIFKKGQFTVQESASKRQSFFSPCDAEYITNSQKRMFKYTFKIDQSEAFVQAGSAGKPVVYWLSVQAKLAQSAGSMARFGWKTSTNYWNDDAVWAQAQERYSGTWQKLNYPAFHPRVNQHTALAFQIMTSDKSTTELIDRQVADDWKCEQSSPVVAAAWWGSYVSYTDEACECNPLPKPVRPDYFLLSIWSDVPKSNPRDPQNFSHPGQKLWEYRAYQYDEVQVGSDGDPAASRTLNGREPVFRYFVTLPANQRFDQDPGSNVYWFSVVAVYEYPKIANYPWGWTNHAKTFNDDAVAGSETIGTAGKKVWTWQPLKDQTGMGEDMSFILFQQAQALGPPPVAVAGQ
jgi:hypothetical protein